MQNLAPLYTPDHDDDWRAQAQCRDQDPDLMQPEVATAEQVGEALAVCEGCPVMAECRELAEEPGAYGVHAGEWFGDPPERPNAMTVVGEDQLRELFAAGKSIRRVAADYGLTVKQVRTARDKIMAA